MSQQKADKISVKYLTPDNLYEQINTFTVNMAVTKGMFELLIDRCTFVDMEWNHMDQLHRPSIHDTYEKGIRIALGQDFAVSLTQWKKWPLFITVTDVFVARGLFYQTMTIAGVIFLHSIISIEQVNDKIKIKNEWYIASHKWLKLLHKFLDKKLYNLNKRLQEEDAQIRHGRFDLREKGFCFRTDKPDFYNSNIVSANTIYPQLDAEAFISIDDLNAEAQVKQAGNLEFIVRKDDQHHYHIWPAVCPHEGGPLINGKFCDKQIVCPWHGLRFNGVQLSAESPQALRYGFEYTLSDNKIYVKQPVSSIVPIKHDTSFVNFS